ncbi:hypothetical protein CLOM_g20051 [Closterium sp. NIES-68]|nr:hypothetical protein CLOM_g20051 [Closterium sp. NIES-68]GJP73927.1 hypothetical protein CLOP_g4592 [Closterium sp. NIES-67]
MAWEAAASLTSTLSNQASLSAAIGLDTRRKPSMSSISSSTPVTSQWSQSGSSRLSVSCSRPSTVKSSHGWRMSSDQQAFSTGSSDGFISSHSCLTKTVSPNSDSSCSTLPYCFNSLDSLSATDSNSSSNSSSASVRSHLSPLCIPTLGSATGSELRSAAGSAPSPLMVECFEVERCEGLEGHVSISGAKNSALAVLAGAICSSEPLVLRRVPDLHDIRRMFQVLQSVGVKIQRGVDGQDSSVLVDASCLTSVEPCPDVVRKLRASFFVIGALVGRQGEAVVPLPGGCNIGARPIDLHVRGLEALGAKVDIRQGRVHVHTADGGRLKGGSFYLDFPSVGATETLMMAAALADGETILSNVAQEPEVVDLADFLISCGAQIRGAGTNTIVIKGVLRLGPAEFTIIPDRIEAGTFLAAAAITRSVVSLSPVIPRHLTAVISKLRAMGCRVQQTKIGTLKISPGIWPLRATEVTTLPYPGFPTDMQPQLMSVLTTASGQSVIKETVFESRMRHVEELQKMGAKIKITGSTAIISGRDQGSQLYGAPVAATDLRAGAALVLAGMAAEGRTHIEGVAHIDRGYERLDSKLRGLGARIQRLPCLPAELTL